MLGALINLLSLSHGGKFASANEMKVNEGFNLYLFCSLRSKVNLILVVSQWF